MTSAFGRGLTSTTPSTGPVVGVGVGVVEGGEERKEEGRHAQRRQWEERKGERERGVPIWSERYACYLVPSTLSI